MIVNVFGYAERLEKSGFTKSQAEASLQILVEVMNQEFATKEDIRMLSKELEQSNFALRSEIGVLRSDLHSEIGMLRKELHSEVALIRSDMDKLGDKLTIRLGGMMLAGFSLMFAMLQIYK